MKVDLHIADSACATPHTHTCNAYVLLIERTNVDYSAGRPSLASQPACTGLMLEFTSFFQNNYYCFNSGHDWSHCFNGPEEWRIDPNQ